MQIKKIDLADRMQKALSNKLPHKVNNRKFMVLFINTLVQELHESMKNGDTVMIKGLGVFKPRTIKARSFTANLPNHSKIYDEIDVPPKKSYRFELSETIKKLLNKAHEDTLTFEIELSKPNNQ